MLWIVILHNLRRVAPAAGYFTLRLECANAQIFPGIYNILLLIRVSHINLKKIINIIPKLGRNTFRSPETQIPEDVSKDNQRQKRVDNGLKFK